MAKKLNIEYIRKQFEKEKYILSTNNYINAHQKLIYICSRGHKHSITWNNWKKRYRCPYCYGNVKKDIVFIAKEFEKEGYYLKTNIYLNSFQKLEYICPVGHNHFITWSDWQAIIYRRYGLSV